MNLFQDINKKQASIPLQEYDQEKVIKKKVGRPSRPNMGKYLIKMDKALHAKLVRHAEELGINNSFVIAQSLREYFAKYMK